MKQFKLTLVLTVLMSMVGLQAFADWDTSTKVENNGIYYYLDNDNLQAQVTSMPSGKYTGDIMIPSTFTYNKTNYSVTSIGNSAFRDCTSLTSVTIPNSVTSIGRSAFSGCLGLTSVTIPNIVTSIDDYAFKGCSSLTSVTIPNSVTSIGDRAFSDCPSLTSMLVESGNTKYDSRNDCNAIIETASNTLIAGCKATIIPNSVTNIGNRAFERCSALTSIDIPYGVTSIGNHAFDDCSDLTSVTIPNSVTSIGDRAFSDCGLTSVTIPNSVTSIGNCAFEDCPNLASIVVESGNPNYDSRNDCNAIIETASNTLIAGCKNTIIPNNVTSIGSYAFYGCSGLTSITIPNSVTSIGDEAFDGCSGLTSVTIGNSVTSIGQGAFYNCSTLKKVIVSDIAVWCGISFGDSYSNPLRYAQHLYRDENTEITDLVIPDGVTSIGNSAFSGCSGLTSIIIPNSVTSIGNSAFSGCSALTSVIIPNSVKSIGDWAFSGCSGLTSVTIPNSVTSIGGSAFEGCSGLTSITIGSSATSIGDYAFYGCSSLTSVTVLNPTPVVISPNVFAYYVDDNSNAKQIDVLKNQIEDLIEIQIQTNATLYVPKGSKEAYLATDVWKDFKDIVEIEVTGIDQISFQENGEQGIDEEGAVWYTIDGKREDKPKKGINIIRMKNGTTKKVVVK